MKRILLSLCCLAMVACTPTKPNDLQAEQVRDLIEQARDAQAETLAPIEFRFASKKMQLWQQAMDERDRAKADMLLQQARVDAQLALVKARAAKAVQQMNQLNEQVKKLQAQVRQAQESLQ